MVRVKICGITNASDARTAVRLGADVVGLNLYTGPRCISIEQARAIAAVLPPFVTKVALLGKDDASKAPQICELAEFDGVQLHGFEGAEAEAEWAEATAPLHDSVVIKPVRVRAEEDVARLPRFRADIYLLDAYVEGQEGGTGRTFDWGLAQTAREHGLIMLAGGLKPGNVAEAVRRVRPYAVDCSSGVESEPGKKDRAKLRGFIDNAKASLMAQE